MPKVRTLVPVTHPTTGEQFAAGAEVDVAEDVFAAWRADGKASSIDDEEAQAKALEEGGSFSARVGRSDVGQVEAPTAVNAPESKDDDKPRTRRS